MNYNRDCITANLPDLLLLVREATNWGSLLTRAAEVDVSAFSQARLISNKVSPTSSPH